MCGVSAEGGVVSATVEVAVPSLHPGQAAIYADRARFNVLECGRRFGKTAFGEALAIGKAAERFQPVGWFAPTYKLILEVWQDIYRATKGAVTRSSLQERRLELLGGGVIEFWSLDDPDAGRGRKYGRVILDEASLVRELQSAWEGAIRPTLTDLKGDAWFLGTPKGTNYFHRLFLRGETGDDGWRSWRRATVDNPYIDAAEVEAAKRDLPPDVFAQEYLGVPAADAGNPFGADAIQAAAGELSTGEPVAWGWDLAKAQDWTVGLALDDAGRCCRFHRWRRPWGETRTRIGELTDAQALVDSTGVGDPILEDLHREHGARFEGFKFSQHTKQQLMEGLVLALQRRELSGLPPAVIAELESFEYVYRPGGSVSYAAAHGMHDDCVVALALARAQLQKSRAGGWW